MRRIFEDEIRRAVRADVDEAVQFVRRLENNSAGVHGVRPVALDGRERAFLENHDLLVRVPVRRVRRLTGIQRRDMALEIRERGRGRVEDIATLAGLGRRRLEVCPVKKSGVHHRFGGGLREGKASNGKGNGNNGNQQIAAGNFHADISAANAGQVKRADVR